MAFYMIFGHGGLGAALVEALTSLQHKVMVVTRQPESLADRSVTAIDFSQLKSTLEQALPDYIINTIGILHDTEHKPEKNIQQLSSAWLNKSIEVNVWPTVYITQLLASCLKRQSSLKVLVLSARVSSITDNRLGGWYSYRMSKAALNMLVKNIAIEWARQYPRAAIYAYHPGTVDTPLSKPFQANVAPEKLFTAQVGAQHLLKVFSQLSLKASGGLFDWQGQPIPW